MISPNDLIAALEKQRNVQAGEAARMAAAYEGIRRELAAAHERIAELESAAAKKAPKGSRK